MAAGRADAYAEHGGARGLKPWDLAAGALLVAEAGGRFTDHLGGTDELEGAGRETLAVLLVAHDLTGSG